MRPYYPSFDHINHSNDMHSASSAGFNHKLYPFSYIPPIPEKDSQRIDPLDVCAEQASLKQIDKSISTTDRRSTSKIRILMIPAFTPFAQKKFWKALFILAFTLSLSTSFLWGQSNVEFYVPFPDQDLRSSLKVMTDAANRSIGSSINTVISITVVEDGAVIIYDHWEDGYEADPNNPVQSSTLIFGDGNAGNGNAASFCTGCSESSLGRGDVLFFENDIPIPRNASNILFDGRDKLISNRFLAVSRAGWSPSPGTVLSGAVEVIDRSTYGTQFFAPVGENTADQNQMFEHTELYVMAAENNTLVSIDADANGSFEMTMTLNEGESYRVAGGVEEGAEIMADKPVQAHLIAGDLGAAYEIRWFTLYPTDIWDNTYYNPVSTTQNNDPAYVYLYNPGPGSITVDYNTLSGSGTTPSIAAEESYRFIMPLNSGARFTSTSNFFALTTVDSDPDNSAHDWGLTLLPESYLTQCVSVGWGPGANMSPSNNGSPIWVIATAPTTIFADFDGDPGNGFDESFTVSAFESIQIYDNTDNDQTGMNIYTEDGTKLAAAWGQDPSTASPGNPFLDMGTTVPPSLIMEVSKEAVLNDLDADGLLDVGETVTYNISIRNLGVREAMMVVVEDIIPDGMEYVANSTVRTSTEPGVGGPIPDNANPTTAFPLDEGGFDLMDFVGGQIDVVSFEMVATADIITMGLSVVTNSAIITTTDGRVFEPKDDTPTDQSFVGCDIDFTDNGFTPVLSYEENSSNFISATLSYLTGEGSITVLVENTTNNDKETVTLIETGPSTGVYQGQITTSTSSGGSQQDGTVLAVVGDVLTVTYTNDLYGDGCSANASIVLPSFTKPLYLSTDGSGSPDQDLDRIDPVATLDGSTALSETVQAGGGTISAVQSLPLTAQTDNASSLTFSHDPGNGADKLLLVGISVGNSGLTGDPPTVTDVTYDGASINFVGTRRSGTGGGNSDDVRVYIYSLVNPADGPNDIEITLSSSGAIVAQAVTFTGVDQVNPLGNFQSANGTSSPASLNVTSALGERVFSVVAFDHDFTSSNDVSIGAGQTEVFNDQTGNVTGAASLEDGAATVATTYTGPSQDWALGAVSIKPGSSGSGTTTFTQAPNMCADLNLPVGGNVVANLYINVTGTIPVSPDISAVVKYGSTTIIDLGNNPIRTFLGGTSYLLVYNGSLGSNVTIPAGEAVVLEVTLNEGGYEFEIEYDSQTRPSKIDLPATSVIDIDNLAVYDAPFPGGSVITDEFTGTTVYVRTVVSDPFGDYDITGLDLEIVDPFNTSTFATGTEVGTAGCTKTYEYVWNTPTTPGNYDLIVTAKEGFENTVVDEATTPFTLEQLDLGTPCMIEFTDAASNPQTTFLPNDQICVSVLDADQDLTGAPDQVTVSITTSGGDLEPLTLTETGNNTGVFEGCITSNIAAGSIVDGTLNAAAGDIITVNYTDPDDGGDVCTTNAQISTPTAAVSIIKTLVTPADAGALQGETITFEIAISNSGGAGAPDITALTLNDDFDNDCLTFVSSSLGVPNNTSTNGNITTLEWINDNAILPIAGGEIKIVTVTFTGKADGNCDPTTNTAYTTNVTAGGALADDTDDATVTITNPELTVTKTLTSPAGGTAAIGEAVSYQIIIENTGNTSVNTLPLQDVFSDFCLEFVSASTTPDATGAGLLSWNNLAMTPLLPTQAIILTVNFTAKNDCAPAENTATVEFAIDENGDPVPLSESTATVNTVENPVIGIAKNLTSVTSNMDGTYTVNFELTVENFGDVPLNDLKIFDDIITQFTGGSPTGFTATDGTLNATANWDGTASSNILASGQSLAVNATGTVNISFTISVATSASYNNQATAEGTSPADATVTDISTDGLDPDGTTTDDNPTEMVPTPVVIQALPDAVDDPNGMTDEDTPVNIDVLTNDTFGDDGPATGPITVTVQPSNGTAVVNDGGTPTDPTDDTVDYTPNADFNGTDMFTYEICDGTGDCDQAIATVIVAPVNDTPDATDDVASTNEDTPTNIAPLPNDDFGGDGPGTGTITILTPPTNGTAVVNDGGTPNDPTDDTVDYTPDPDFNSSDTDACTGNNAPSCEPFLPCADGSCPALVDYPSALLPTGPPAGGVRGTDANFNLIVGGDFTVTNSGGAETEGRIAVGGNFIMDRSFYGTSTSGGGTYVIGPDGENNLIVRGDILRNEVSTGTLGNAQGGTSIVGNIFVGGSVAGNITTNSGNPATVMANQGTAAVDALVDVQAILAGLSAKSDCFTGLTPTGSLNAGTFTLEGDGTSATQVFNLSAADLATLSGQNLLFDNIPADATIIVNVTASGTVNWDVANVIAGVASDPGYAFYGAPDGDVRVFNLLFNFNSASQVNFNSSINGSLLVKNANVNLLGNVNGRMAIGGSLTHSGSGTEIHNYSFTGDCSCLIGGLCTDMFTYEICDADGDCDQAVVTITVNPVDDMPIAEDDTETTPEDTPINIDPLSNDDFGGDGPSMGTITIITPPTNGTATVNDGGTPTDPTDDTVDYTPNPDYNGTDMFTYEICDVDGDCDPAVVTVTINPVNDTPTANNDNATTDEDTPVNIDALVNDDFGGDGPSVGPITILTPPANGTGIVNDGGTPTDPTDDSIDYTPNAGYSGPDQIVYQICDGNGDCDVAFISITVNSVNDVPVADDDTETTDEDTPVNITVLTNDDFGDDGPSMGTITITSPPTNGTAVR
jgi:choice-of-anchor A domain-containing protein/uncharacterized repeat protein (TIGR01451 family)